MPIPTGADPIPDRQRLVSVVDALARFLLHTRSPPAVSESCGEPRGPRRYRIIQLLAADTEVFEVSFSPGL
jgi:hypothetical protein